MKFCEQASCNNKQASKGLCHKHYSRLRRGSLKGELVRKPHVPDIYGPTKPIGNIAVMAATATRLERMAECCGVSVTVMAGRVLDGWSAQERGYGSETSMEALAIDGWAQNPNAFDDLEAMTR